MEVILGNKYTKQFIGKLQNITIIYLKLQKRRRYPKCKEMLVIYFLFTFFTVKNMFKLSVAQSTEIFHFSGIFEMAI